MAKETLLCVENLHLQREGQEILRGMNLQVSEGQIHAVLGRNGSGKSTLAYTLMGCASYKPSEGHIFFDGRDITDLSIDERARLGITLAWQEPARFEGLTVRRYLQLGQRTPDDERVEQALMAVNLPSSYLKRSVDDALSGGERKRIELAAVYAMRPRLAILDEPDSGIDTLSLDDIARLIRRMAVEGTTVLLITHRDEIVAIADQASLVCGGLVLYSGDPLVVSARYERCCEPCDRSEIVEEMDAYE